MPHRLYWFRAFSYPTPEDVERGLFEGLSFNPSPDCETARLEHELGIDPRQVYAYLGMTLEAFGGRAVALPVEPLDGAISPFDSGGLVDDHEPVRAWDQEARRDYLDSCTWPDSDLPERFAAHPGLGADLVEAYLRGDAPAAAGPHECFDGVPEAAIWRDARLCSAWLWELRVPGRLATGERIVRWTCPDQQRDAIATAARARGTDWAVFLEQAFVRGGTSRLVRELREEQVQRWRG